MEVPSSFFPPLDYPYTFVTPSHTELTYISPYATNAKADVEKWAKRMIPYLNRRMMMDCTGNIGGDAAFWAGIAKHVVSFEKDRDRAMCLIHNTKPYGVEAYHGDALRYDFSSKSVVLFDPPWGEEYKPGAADKITLEMMPDEDIYETILQLPRRVKTYYIIKAPANWASLRKFRDEYRLRVPTRRSCYYYCLMILPKD